MKKKILSFCAVLALFLSVTTTASACGEWWNEFDEVCCENGQSHCANDCPPDNQ